ncbi:hypothetical protein [Herbiconiux daphne]|uniref:DUF3558 domain-containing protein n=1 Tax=Herbiconiux daphne TaxID=2970914 RepID=A0ABT2H2X3_9MICO|nr:hypothetical protein [Herbiconiux daphne]MCS5734246.1 hypothetical protein [Herbiconiux daphne]
MGTTDSAAGRSPEGGRPRTGRRTRLIVGIVVAVAIVAVGATVAGLVLTGGSPSASAPATTSAAPTPTPTPTATATPTPTPTAAPVVAPVRVPLTCPAVLSSVTAQQLVGAPVVGSGSPRASNPLAYSDLRTGSLTCTWVVASATTPAGGIAPRAFAIIVPDVTDEDYFDVAGGVDFGASPPIPGFGDDSRELCQTGTEVPVCALIDHVANYGVQVGVVPASQTISDETVSATRALFGAVADAVVAAGPPGPLWQPQGANLVGASGCDGLLTTDQLVAITGDPAMRVFREYEGEFRIATFRSNRQVGGYGCGWSGGGASITAMVLPGGAGYISDSVAGGGSQWLRTSGYPGTAYVSDSGDHVAVLVDNAWFDVKVPVELAALLPQLAAQLVANVQAAG